MNREQIEVLIGGLKGYLAIAEKSINSSKAQTQYFDEAGVLAIAIDLKEELTHIK